MSYSYAEASIQFLAGEHNEFSHLLMYANDNPEPRENFYNDEQSYRAHLLSCGYSDYNRIVNKLVNQMGSVSEVWNDNKIIPGPDGLRYDWEIVSIVPFVMAFRSKDLAMMAKIILE